MAFALLASVHICLVGRIDSIGLVGISDLDHVINHNGLSLISLVDCTGPDVFIGRTLIYHISLVSSIGNISLAGLGGFGGDRLWPHCLISLSGLFDSSANWLC